VNVPLGVLVSVTVGACVGVLVEVRVAVDVGVRVRLRVGVGVLFADSRVHRPSTIVVHDGISQAPEKLVLKRYSVAVGLWLASTVRATFSVTVHPWSVPETGSKSIRIVPD